jgi:hypothetical protein
MAKTSRFGGWWRRFKEAGNVDKFETGNVNFKTVPQVTKVWVADLECHCTCDDYYGCFDCDRGCKDCQQWVISTAIFIIDIFSIEVSGGVFGSGAKIAGDMC